MQKKIIFLALVAVLLAGCLPGQSPQDISSQVNTAVAQTMEANSEIEKSVEQTVAALQPEFTPTLVPTFEIVPIFTDTPFLIPTNTPFPTNTPGTISGGGGGSSGGGGGSSSSNNQYSCAIVAEKPFDGKTFKPGDEFDKSWTIKNTGTVTWGAGWDFEYRGGTDISPTGDFSIGQQVKPGQTITIVIEVIVPEVAYKDSGKIFVMTWSLNNGSHFCTPYVAITVVP